MKKIELSGKVGKGKYVFVDDENFIWLNQWKWHNEHGYASRERYWKDREGKLQREEIYMHRLVLNCPKNKKIDHRNGNGLDNQKDNLRIATHQQNIANQKLRKDNTSNFKGVYFDKGKNRRKRWTSQIMVNQKHIHLGRFFTPNEAALAYNQGAKKYFGKFAYLNQIGGNI